MGRVLTEKQEPLTKYFAEVGCDVVAAFLMVTELWDEKATIEMLEFCANHPSASQAELLEASAKISAKYEEPESLLEDETVDWRKNDD